MRLTIISFTIQNLYNSQIKPNQIKCWFLERGENWSTQRKTSRSRVENKLSPLMTPSLGIEPGTHWWKASTLTTAPTLLRCRIFAWRDCKKDQSPGIIFFSRLPHKSGDQVSTIFCRFGRLPQKTDFNTPPRSKPPTRKFFLINFSPFFRLMYVKIRVFIKLLEMRVG